MADDESIYSEKGRENLVDDDEISPAEEGFMEGAEGDGQGAQCRKGGTILMDDEVCRFCCEECADKYSEEKEE